MSQVRPLSREAKGFGLRHDAQIAHMKHKHRIKKDHRKRFCVQRYEHKRVTLKTIQNHSYFTTQKRLIAIVRQSKLKKNSSRVKVHNRCVLTGRSRGVYDIFKISRIMIRELASKGLLPGIKKAS